MKWRLKHKGIIVEVICYLFILLFVYAAVSKLLDFENFRVQLGQSPLLTAFSGWVAWAVPVVEILVAVMLIFPRFRLWGLYAAFSLMVMFTTYIVIILNFSDFIPCSCGGVLEKLGWNEHLVFNLGFIIIGLIGIFLIKDKNTLKPLTNPIILRSLSLLVLLCIGIVIFLFLVSENKIHYRNPFVRRFPPNPIEFISEKDLQFNSYYISGMGEGKVYLANQTAPLHMLILDDSLKVSRNIEMSIFKDSVPYRSVKTIVAPPYFYIFDGTIPYILKGRINKWKATYIPAQAYFSHAAIIDSTNIAIRAKDSKSSENVLGLLNLNNTRPVRISKKLLKKQIDGIFDTDGMLLYNPQLQSIIYTYFYRNEYIIADNFLNILGNGRTIDTISQAKISVSYNSTTDERKMTTPPVIVNKATATYGKHLYVHSMLMGFYEPEDTWERSSVIDVYDLRDKTYSFSFYIQDKGKNKLSGFMISEDRLVCLMGNYIQTYSLDKALFGIYNKDKSE